MVKIDKKSQSVKRYYMSRQEIVRCLKEFHDRIEAIDPYDQSPTSVHDELDDWLLCFDSFIIDITARAPDEKKEVQSDKHPQKEK